MIVGITDRYVLSVKLRISNQSKRRLGRRSMTNSAVQPGLNNDRVHRRLITIATVAAAFSVPRPSV